MNVDEVKIIQDKIEVKKAELIKAEGRKEQLMSQLKDEFGCNTIAEAEAKQAELLTQISTKESELQTAGQEIDNLMAEGIV